MSEITLLLEAVSRGEVKASEELLPLVYDQLRRLAAIRMGREAAGQTLQPTALVHEAWLRLVSEGERTWNNRAHFFRAAAQAMRRILVDRARHKASIKGGGGKERLNIDDLGLSAASPDERVLMVDDSLVKLEQDDPNTARLVTLKFFGGLTNKQLAKSLGVTERTVERQWAYAKARLYRMMQEDFKDRSDFCVGF